MGPIVSYTGSMSSPTDFFLRAFLRNKAAITIPTIHSVIAMTALVVAIVAVVAVAAR